MESVSVNQHMKNPPLNVGIIIPPDSHYTPVLYSHTKASKDFNRLDHDVYNAVQKSERVDKKRTPKSVFAALALGALAICCTLIKKLFKK